MNPYLEQIESVLPRVLGLFDTDPVSPTLGRGDRFHWAWKCIDFGNGAYQGAANGLARLVAAGLLPESLHEKDILERILNMFEGTRTLLRSDGSLEEAFPFEGSYCVTAVVAFDLLAAIEQLADRLDAGQRQKCLGIVAPMINYLKRSDETHGFISNHLAAAAAALYAWADLTGDTDEMQADELLARILSRQSREGWYLEYQGADPGYMTLAITHLAEVLRRRPSPHLRASLERAVDFLACFAHPDGSFGGHYGCRETRIFHPAGIEFLAERLPLAASLARFMAGSISNDACVTLRGMDDTNLIPLFNGYVWAATCRENYSPAEGDVPSLPWESAPAWARDFPEAGLYIRSTGSHYVIVSGHKGGVCYAFGRQGGRIVDVGCVFAHGNGKLYGTQSHCTTNRVTLSEDGIEVESPLTRLRHEAPTPLRFICLRLLNVTAMRFRPVREWVKRFLVSLLMIGGDQLRVTNRRCISLGDGVNIADDLVGADGLGGTLRPVPAPRAWRSLHMASSGYWQKGDGEAS